MQTDFFIKPASKKEQLLEWIRLKKEVKSHELIAWGLQNHYIRADRTARDLAQAGLIERIPKEEKAYKFCNCKEDVWRYKKI